MLTTSDILFGVLLPLVLSGLILAVASKLRKLSYWPGPLAIGIAFTAAFGCIEGSSHIFPPHSAIPWLFYVGLIFAFVGLLDAAIRMPTWLRPIVIIAATVIGAALVLRFNFDNHTWDAAHGSIWLFAIGIVAAIWWCCFESAASEGGIIMPVAAMLTSGIGGLVIMLVADQTVGQALGALAIAFAATVPVIAFFKDVSLARGTSALVAGVGVCALAAAYFVSDVPILDLSLIGIAPLVLVGSRWLPIKKPWLRVSVRLVIVLIPLGVALVLAIQQFNREAAEKSADPYSLVSPSQTMPARCSAYIADT
jgi:hypothetical protein